MMKPFYQDNHATIYNGDCRSMTELPDESVQCVVTSPPYWGLRKYSGEQELIWGDKECEHNWTTEPINVYENKSGQHWQAAYGGATGKNRFGYGNTDLSRQKLNAQYERGFCSLCGAWKGAYGLEPTPEMYIQHTVEIMREIRRVLRKDGCVFWNVGDSYYTQPAGNKTASGFQQKSRAGLSGALAQFSNKTPSLPKHNTLKPKDLCLIPFRVAIALQEDGWWVRSDIIWSKPNPMPESVTDRPTNSHEYIFLLTKSAKYYWDADAVRGKANPETQRSKPVNAQLKGAVANDRRTNYEKDRHIVTARNIRSVWEFPTQPYPEAHFAVFPEKLPEICIKAGTPEAGCCSKCGAPWVRVIKKGFTDHGGETKSSYPEGTTAKRLAKLRQAVREQGGEYQNINKTLGWKPSCNCNADKVPSLVLDPFMGSGTTLWVAKKLNRRATGYDTAAEYCELTVKRLQQQVML